MDHAVKIFRAYIAGTEKAYMVKDALAAVEAVFVKDSVLESALVLEALETDDEERRQELMARAIAQLYQKL